MLKYSFTLLMLMFVVMAFGQYYNSVINLNGNALLLGLRTLISTNTNSDYSDVREEMFGYVDNNNGYVRCVYTGQDYSVPAGTTPDYNVVNTEHTYAQSWFSSSQSSIKKADLFHLFPTNSQVNSSRGNLPFDIVTNASNTYSHSNGYLSKRGSNSGGQTVFEPANQHKGNLARALLYFYVRYNDTLTQAGVNMLPVMLNWHTLDPVDNAEINRNQDTYEYQGNRNPFIDHPEFVQRIWGPVGIINDESIATPDVYIDSVYPNPSAASVSIAYKVTQSGDVQSHVYNLKGQLVKVLEHSPKISGEYSIVWDGADNSGNRVASGIYILQVESGAASATKKILIK